MVEAKTVWFIMMLEKGATKPNSRVLENANFPLIFHMAHFKKKMMHGKHTHDQEYLFDFECQIKHIRVIVIRKATNIYLAY